MSEASFGGEAEDSIFPDSLFPQFRKFQYVELTAMSFLPPESESDQLPLAELLLD